MNYTPGCWFARNVVGCGPCDGQLVRVHLLPRSLLKREFRSLKLDPPVALRALVEDPRSWVWGCGGPMGNGGHNGMLDQSRTVRIARDVLPDGLEEFAAEVGLEWWLCRTYGCGEVCAHG